MKLSETAINILQTSILIIALCVNGVIFSIPVALRHVMPSYDEAMFIENTSNNSLIEATVCDDISWATSDANVSCTSQVYVGSLCKNYLKNWQTCTNNMDHDEVAIDSTISQSIIENELVQLLQVLSDFYPECYTEAVPFLCQYHYPLSDCLNGRIYGASREECIRITTTVCTALQMNITHEENILNCEGLPLEEGSGDVININETLNDTLICHSDFMVVDSTCVPRCDKFEQYSNPIVTYALFYSSGVSGVVAFIVALIIIVVAIRNYKRMFGYHAIMITFMAIDYIIGATFAVITGFSRGKLFCGSTNNVLDAINHPTPYCKVYGAVFQYIIVNGGLWGLFHISILTYKVLFPFHAKRVESLKRQKYILWLLISLGIVLPLPAVIVALSVDTYHYTITQFPPIVCVPIDRDLFYYSIELVLNVIVGVCVCLLIVVFWEVYKYKGKRRKEKYILSTEEKAVIYIVFLLIAGELAQVYRASMTPGKEDRFFTSLLEYFECESNGFVPGKCDRSDFEKHDYPIFVIGTILLFGFGPITIYLIAVVGWESLKTACNKRFKKHPNMLKLSSFVL